MTASITSGHNKAKAPEPPQPGGEEGPLYQSRVKIYPKRVSGTFRNLKWLVMIVTLGVYYVTPWLRWDRGATAPDQAVLLDLPHRRFYFFFIEIWPQEVYYLTGLLILAALLLFLFTSLFGRVWCGYACPQTVWTDLFIWVERLVQGDRNKRMKLDKSPWTATKIAKKSLTHFIWLVLSVATGGAWVFYFADAPSLMTGLLTGEAPLAAYLAIAGLTFTTYSLGGLMREQVCTYMCPWPRIQGAMFDADTFLVSYKPDRGEPRGPHKKGESWDGRGDCIDCQACVAVCPVGIDIRNGPQLECIQCALCIDACNEIMDKIDRPRGLIDYETLAMPDARAKGEKPKIRLVRGRTIIYSLSILLTAAVMGYGLLTRGDLEMSVLRDRNPLFVPLSDGSVRNGYTIKILNKAHETRNFSIELSGMEGLALSRPNAVDSPDRVTVAPDDVQSVRLYVTAPADIVRSPVLADGEKAINIAIRDMESGAVASRNTVFRGPQSRSQGRR
ncbi:ferredoxin [Iodidimonas muriae]|uniref:Ferredoxin n=1 Tax=Iodidimonas muriae TaxID=261467 RepID=A0ABQ2LEQ3_9PROT|nr:cytochrome c oxidase accessory protein CcoG [Iodidimonas muriae]GER07535.1 ferredoxin [Kordiimonadales bacterium JCM 17843]GGO14098.1 ferredoxin [Iodidimonas muriae]